GGAERAEVIERKDVSDHVAKLVAVAHNAHKKRNFEADQNAHNHNKGVENQFEALRESEGHHQERGGKTTDNTEQELDPNETIDEATIQIAGKRAADAHREE